jgi:hypothetical protein
MLAVAKPDGSPLPGLEEWQENNLLDLERDSLVPLWFPHRADGWPEHLAPDQRRAWFVDNLNAIYQQLRRPHERVGNVTASPAPLSPRQHLVLTSLLQLGSIMAPFND